jgi:hypothetical protein
MKFLAVAFLAAAAFPGAALGAGLVQQRDLRPQPSGRSLSPGVFELVGVHWQGTGAVVYRTRSLAGRWSAWRVFGDEDALPDRGHETSATRGWHVSDPTWTGPSNGIQYRTVGRVKRLRAYFVRSPRLGSPTKRVALAGAPAIIPRSGWHADESIRRGRPAYADAVRLAIVHHTVNSNSYTKAQSASIVKGIELYHVKSNGWNDIGYNFLVDKYGQIFEGRYGGMTRPVIGAHAMGFNTGSVGIALIGSYSSTSITPAARAALTSLIAWRLDYAHVDPLSTVARVSSGNPRYPAGRAVTLKAISGHRDVYPTSCPGNALYAQLPSIRTAVSQTGLPKLYTPTVTGTLGGPVRFRARLSNSVTWTATVRDVAGTVVASGKGTGTRVDWTWDAAAAPSGRYSWAITAPQMRAATGTIGSAPAPLSLKQLRVSPTIVSPNGDGRGDVAKVTYRLSTAADVTATVQDALDNPVATIFGGRRAAGKQELAWSPDALNDGWYELTLAASAGGKPVTTSTRFWVDRTLANVAASSQAFSPNGDGRFDALGVSFRLLNPAHVEVRVLRGRQVVATLLAKDLQAGQQRLTWDGSRLPDGRYIVSVGAVDSLLNVTQALPVQIDRKPPSLQLVSFSPLALRVSEPGRLVVAINGRWRRLTVKRAGLVRLGNRTPVRSVTGYAIDLAGNKSRVVRARR